MRFLDTYTGQFVEKDPRAHGFKYAILSHTWEEYEQTYQDLRDIQGQHTPSPVHLPPSNPLVAHNDVPSQINRDVFWGEWDREGEQDPPEGHPQNHPCNTQVDSASVAEDDHSIRPDNPSATSPALNTLPTTLPIVHGVVPPAHLSSPASVPLFLSHTYRVSEPRSDESPELSPLWDDEKLSRKILKACTIARANGYRYIWIDSCCIDKTSSSELSEAINSMYKWYKHAHVCYAFLADVPVKGNHWRKDSKFRTSRWFTRGWTLQELIAPLVVKFLSSEWEFIGSKHTLVDLVAEVTNISDTALLGTRSLKRFSVAQRLSWAAGRETTRVEDRAYSVLGIFDINMPTLYGEGHRAFRRLQEEIMRRIPDQTLFAWSSFPHQFQSMLGNHEVDTDQLDVIGYGRVHSSSEKWDTSPSLWAPSPDVFRDCGAIQPITRDELVRRLQLRHSLHLPAEDYYSTPYGIRTQFPVMPLSVYFARYVKANKHRPLYLVILQCEHKDYPHHALGRVCYASSHEYSNTEVKAWYCAFIKFDIPTSSEEGRKFDLLPLSPPRSGRLRWHPRRIDIKTLYIPHTDSNVEEWKDSGLKEFESYETTELVLRKKTGDDLLKQGYVANLRGPDHDHPTTYWLLLSGNAHTITIKYRHILDRKNTKLTIKAHWYVRVRTSDTHHGIGSETNAGDFHRTRHGAHGTLSWSYDYRWGRDSLSNNDEIQLPMDIPGTEGRWMHVDLVCIAMGHYEIDVRFAPAQISTANPSPVEKRSRIWVCKRWLATLATYPVSRLTTARASVTRDPGIRGIDFKDHQQVGSIVDDPDNSDKCGGGDEACRDVVRQSDDEGKGEDEDEHEGEDKGDDKGKITDEGECDGQGDDKSEGEGVPLAYEAAFSGTLQAITFMATFWVLTLFLAMVLGSFIALRITGRGLAE